MRITFIVLCFFLSNPAFTQCINCGNGSIDAGETELNCPQDVSHTATCTSPCSQPTSFESTTGLRISIDFTGTTTYGAGTLPAGWSFAGAPTATTAGALPAADTYGSKAGLVQPNCSGSCTGTNGFCIGNLANSVAVGSGGSSGKLGANFDGRTNINQNLSYAVLRGQNNPTLVSETFNVSSVEGFKIQFWLFPSESSCGQTNSWGSCTGNNAYLDFSSNGGTSWTQILTMNLSSTNSDMCTNNSSNTLWLTGSSWSRVCLTVFKSSTSPGNFYSSASSTTAASGIMVNSTYFTANFKYRIRYSQSASCTGTVTTTNPGRYLAIDYPVFTSGNEMIPCGISFSNMCGYGADGNDDGVGSNSSTTTSVAFGTVKRGVNQAERGVEILTSQTAAYASQNLSGSSLATNYDLCNAEGGDRQCMDWRTNNNFYTAVYECITDWEAPSGTGINVRYFKGTTAQSTGMSKVTTSGKTASIGWRYSANRIVSCGSTTDLNPGCNGYSFSTGSLPTQFARGFYGLAINSIGQSWSFYGATSCSNYFNGPFFSPISVPDTISGSPDYITCNGGNPVFTGTVNYCSNSSGFTGSGQINITGPNGFSETITSGGIGLTPIVDEGSYTITPQVPGTPAQCLDCERPVCITVTNANLEVCNLLPVELINFEASCDRNIITVDWCTASEFKNDYFILEDSPDGINFKPLQQVKGQGTSTMKYCYQVKTEAPQAVKYFRLKQVDFDQTSKTSKLISVLGCQPIANLISVTGDTKKIKVIMDATYTEPMHLYVHNVLGQQVQEEIIPANTAKGEYIYPLKNNLQGVYMITLYTASEKIAQNKIFFRNN